MSRLRVSWPESAMVSLLAGFTAWVSLFAWRGLVDRSIQFLLPLMGLAFLVAVVGALLRSARLSFPVVVLAQAVAVGIWMNHAWAAGSSVGGWVPTPSSVDGVVGMLSRGVAAAQEFAAPVPASETGMHALLVACGAAVLLLVDLLACGLRRVPLAGLVLLAVYAVPASIVLGSASWWVFALSAMGFLLLQATQEAHRLGHWGRYLGQEREWFDSVSTTVNGATLRGSARRIGLVTTGLAILLPALIPTLNLSLFAGNGPGSGDNGDSVAIVNPIVDLRRDLVRGRDVDLVDIRTTQPNPAYLRVSTLDVFDGKTWKPSGRDIPVEQRAEGRIPRPPGLEPDVERTEVPWRITLRPDFKSTWLPAPYPVSYLNAPGDWRYDRTTLDFVSANEDQKATDLSYRLRALDVDIEPQNLVNAPPAPDAVFTPNTALPSDLPGLVSDLARQVTRGQQSNFEKAVRLQRWFREDGGFTYSTRRAAGNSIDTLTQFLGDGPRSRIGYCEQFAASMALMGRSLGIPSRVAVGFLRPEKTGPDRWTYSAHDLHSWPEMYFEGTGWVRFEPTPQARASTVPSYTSQGVSAPAPSDPASSDATLPQNRLGRQPGGQGLETAGPTGQGTSPVPGLAWAVAGVLVVALLLLPRGLRSASRARRWRTVGAARGAVAVEAAWEELRATTLDHRLAWNDHLSPRAMARSLVRGFAAASGAAPSAPPRRRSGAHADPEATDALERVVRAVERARFSPQPGHPEADLRADVERCSAALRAGVSRGRRRRARWFPASVVARGRRTARSAAPAGNPAVDHAV